MLPVASAASSAQGQFGDPGYPLRTDWVRGTAAWGRDNPPAQWALTGVLGPQHSSSFQLWNSYGY